MSLVRTEVFHDHVGVDAGGRVRREKYIFTHSHISGERRLLIRDDVSGYGQFVSHRDVGGCRQRCRGVIELDGVSGGVTNRGHLLKIVCRRYRNVTDLDILSLYVRGTEGRVGDIQVPCR